MQRMANDDDTDEMYMREMITRIIDEEPSASEWLMQPEDPAGISLANKNANFESRNQYASDCKNQFHDEPECGVRCSPKRFVDEEITTWPGRPVDMASTKKESIRTAGKREAKVLTGRSQGDIGKRYRHSSRRQHAEGSDR